MSRRMGGRSARRALREAPPAEEDKAVKPGMAGDRFKPLTDAEVERIHEAALDVLENIGIGEPIPSCTETTSCRASGQSGTPSGPSVSVIRPSES